MHAMNPVENIIKSRAEKLVPVLRDYSRAFPKGHSAVIGKNAVLLEVVSAGEKRRGAVVIPLPWDGDSQTLLKQITKQTNAPLSYRVKQSN